MAQALKPDIYGLSPTAIDSLCVAGGYSRSDARAVWRWLYNDLTTDFGQMVTLREGLRGYLAAQASLAVPDVLLRCEDPASGGRKDLLQMRDSTRVEVVLLRYRHRNTGCISSQVGCPCGCPFCATGQMGFIRDLASAEMVAQVVHLQRELSSTAERLSNIVIMGMGEPLLNYHNTLQALEILTDSRGLAFPGRRITLSTVGITPGIRRLAAETVRVNLAVSLHAATDELRSELVPVSRQYPLSDLLAAIRQYTESTARAVMFEWVMISGVNDSPEQARQLTELVNGIPCHINLIRLNHTEGYAGRAPDDSVINAFAAILDQSQIRHTIRQRFGTSISAGCGQLRTRYRNSERRWPLL